MTSRSITADFTLETLSVSLSGPINNILDEVTSHELFHYLFSVSTISSLSVIDKWFSLTVNVFDFLKTSESKRIGLPFRKWLSKNNNIEENKSLLSMFDNVASDRDFVFGRHDPGKIIAESGSIEVDVIKQDFGFACVFEEKWGVNYPYLIIGDEDHGAFFPIGKQLIEENLISIIESSEFNSQPINRYSEKIDIRRFAENSSLNLAIKNFFDIAGIKDISLLHISVMYIVSLFLNEAPIRNSKYSPEDKAIYTPGENLIDILAFCSEDFPISMEERPANFADRICLGVAGLSFKDYLELSKDYLKSKVAYFNNNHTIISCLLADKAVKIIDYFLQYPEILFLAPQVVFTQDFFMFPQFIHLDNKLGFDEEESEKNIYLWKYYCESQIVLNLIKYKKVICPFFRSIDCNHKEKCIQFLKNGNSDKAYYPECPERDGLEKIIGNLDRFYSMA